MFSVFRSNLFGHKRPSGSAPRRRARRRRVEPLEPRAMLSGVPFGAEIDDTAEFMLGDVTVTVVLMESTGVLDPSTEDWNLTTIREVKDRVEEGLQWWVDALDAQGTVHELNFNIDYTYADTPVPTRYEPIGRDSGSNPLWVNEFLDLTGFKTSQGVSADIRAFNHAQRAAHGSHWAFTIFVANSDADADDRFPLGGFRGAFGYAGGRYFVTPSKREAGTFAHETGHMFWARDEYTGAGSYDDTRGYYNTQNLNAIDDRPGDAPPLLTNSIMYTTSGNIASPSAMEMIGWRDSDGDGVFDVLDVPHTLEGSGYLDPDTHVYHFAGASSVRTLPNQNPAGLQNDVTINEISRAQYRLDGGAWTDAAVYHAYTADLDLAIGPLPSFETIEIRTIDDPTQVASPIFTGYDDRPGAVLVPGVNGAVWQDDNVNGQWDAGEAPVGGLAVTVLDTDGNPLPGRHRVEPDEFDDGTTLAAEWTPGAALSAFGSGVWGDRVGAMTAIGGPPSTGTRAFVPRISNGGWGTNWNSESRQMRIDFDVPATTLSIDAIGDSNGALGRLEAYDAAGNLLARYSTGSLLLGQAETMTLARAEGDVAYAVARAHADTVILLDNLLFGADGSAVTDAAGFYAVPDLAAGDYTIAVETPAGWAATSPRSGTHEVRLASAESIGAVDFGLVDVAGASWQNPANPLDVNDDGVVAPIDVLQIINDLNANGARLLAPRPTEPAVPPPYYDVNADGYVSPLDALQILNYLNAQAEASQTAQGEPRADGAARIAATDRLLAEAEPRRAGHDSMSQVQQDNSRRAESHPTRAALAPVEYSSSPLRHTEHRNRHESRFAGPETRNATPNPQDADALNMDLAVLALVSDIGIGF